MLGLVKIPPALPLSVTLALLAGGIIYSLIKTRAAKPDMDQVQSAG